MAILMRSKALNIMRALCIPYLLMTLFYAACSSQVAAEVARPTIEYQIKASLIFNFIQFVEWPPEVTERFPTTLNVCIVGHDRFGAALAEFEKGIIQGKRTEVTRATTLSEKSLANCQIVFIAHDAEIDSKKILAEIKALPILTVG